MTSFLGLMMLGLFLGMRHATDPDHVIAVTTIVSRQRTPGGAWALGAAWGVGHTITIMLVGGGIILFGWVIPPRVGLSTELSVGVMLIVLGIMNLLGVMKSVKTAGAHSHSHAEDQADAGWLDRRLGSLGAYRLVRPLLVGVVHGLAGSAAVALLVLATIRSPRWAILYLLVFGLGTILGMMLMTTMIVLPFAYSDRRSERVNQGLRLASGLISVTFGLFVAYQIGIVNGLFTGNPQWTPK